MMKRIAVILCVSAVCVSMGVRIAHASEDIVRSCTYTWTDCNGGTFTVSWTCVEGQCCVQVNRTNPGFGDSCIQSVDTGCCP